MEPTESPTRDLTVDEAVHVAILLQQQGQFAEAGELYRRVFDVAPDHPRALHYAGVLAHQRGRTGEALALIARSLTLAPDRAESHNNLGIVLQSAGKLDEAISAYRQAIAIDPRHANAHSNLGVLLRATGRPSEAEASYRAAIAQDPNHIDAYTNLGILLNALQRPAEASACFCRVVTLRPKHKEARRLLALAHCMLGEIDEAVTIFDAWLAEEPGNPIAQHMRAACTAPRLRAGRPEQSRRTGREVPARASDAFVTMTFDSFAASFEAKLERLSYRAPALIAAMLEQASLTPSKQLEILDAGCGTGLCGPLVAPYARRLTGIDLSEGMLTLARAKGVYDSLERVELTAYLREHPRAFDVIVAADTLVYFGDLEAVVSGAARALRPDGWFVFTLERSVDASDADDYRLEIHGRYSHAQAYVEQLLAKVGLRATIAHADLRLEAGSPVPGLVVRATGLTPRLTPV